jgi:hypothetical protein
MQQPRKHVVVFTITKCTRLQLPAAQCALQPQCISNQCCHFTCVTGRFHISMWRSVSTRQLPLYIAAVRHAGVVTAFCITVSLALVVPCVQLLAPNEPEVV